MYRMALSRRGNVAFVLLGTLCITGGLVVLYWSTLHELVRSWEDNPANSHGYLVPIVSLLFAWRAWRSAGPSAAATVGGGTVALGWFELALGVALRFASTFLDVLLWDVFSLILVLRGLLLILGGRDAVRRFGFPVLFLVFMAPLPVSCYQWIAVALQQVVSDLSTMILLVLEVPVYRDGYVLHLPGYEMEVGAACSGLTQLTAYVALTLAVAHFSKRRVWYKVALVLMALPIAIAANCVRVTATGILLVTIGPKWAEGLFHTLEGVAIIGLGALLLMLVAWCLAILDDHFHSDRSNNT